MKRTIRIALLASMVAGVSLGGAAEPVEDSLQSTVPRTPWTPPVWWFGIAAGANLNFYEGTTQQLNSGLITPAAFHKGFGAGLYLAPVLEYRPDPVWGGILQLGYDSRRGRFDDVVCPCGEIATLEAKPAYLTLEPSLRVSPWGGDLYFFAGPRVGVLAPWVNPNGFHYTREGFPDNNGNFSQMRRVVYSGQVGAGYEFDWKREDTRDTRIKIAPFLSYQPHFGQDPRDGSGIVDRWALSTLRAGVVFKAGRPRSPLALLRFSARAPKTVITVHKIQETFPLRNYVFFEEGSTEIPERYTLLSKPQASAFREEQLQNVRVRGSGRSGRQMAVYHHVLNIVGSRLQRLPGTSITLVGLSSQDAETGRKRSETVRRYLTEIFGIEMSRIGIEGRMAPAILTTDTMDVRKLRAENERVEIQSRSPDLLVQIGEGTNMLKPVQITDESAGMDSVIFSVRGAGALESWWLDLTDDLGNRRRYGPYTGNRTGLPALPLLGDRSTGVTYVAIFTGRTPDGITESKRDVFHLSRRNAGVEKTTRYTVLFDLDQGKAVSSYERFLRETVTERIPDSSTVFIRGRTDEIGDPEHNLDLSEERAQGVRKILKSSVSNADRRAVELVPSWSGEDAEQAPFGSDTPEERSYNRTVIIDIVPE